MTKGPKARSDITPASSESSNTRLARLVVDPHVTAALSIKSISSLSDDVDLRTIIGELSSRANEVHEGDLKSGEAMLISQAHCLNATFNRLVGMAAASLGGNVNAADTLLRLAFKAQSQCRATMETLAEMKNPRPAVAFVRQANIAQGHQQVNNGAAQMTGTSRAGKKKKRQQNELLETNDGERLDTGTTNAAAGTDSTVEAVGTVNRPKNRRRKI